jgi:hypothetical protein
MGRVFLLFCALVGVSVFAQVPMESTVTLSVSYAPRSSAKLSGCNLREVFNDTESCGAISPRKNCIEQKQTDAHGCVRWLA